MRAWQRPSNWAREANNVFLFEGSIIPPPLPSNPNPFYIHTGILNEVCFFFSAMKIKNKGKVYPSPSSSSSSSFSTLSSDYVLHDPDFFSILKLLPVAIIALVSALSVEDREVLAYLITRSVKSVTPPSVVPETKRKYSKRVVGGGGGGGGGNGSSHKPPVFDCDCFDCYRSYWFRWDSSANRELIHQAIEALEDQLTSGEKSKRNSGRSKRRDRTVRRDLEKPTTSTRDRVSRESVGSSASPEPVGDSIGSSSRSNERNLEEGAASNTSEKKKVVKPAEEETGELQEEEDDMSEIVRESSAGNSHKGVGIARKVLPDVLGLLNHRLWSLWSPQM